MIGPKVGLKDGWCFSKVISGDISKGATDPFRGPIDHIEKANARYSSLTMSLTEPGALAIMALPATAPRNRTTRTSAREVARPHGMMSNMKNSILHIYTGLLP